MRPRPHPWTRTVALLAAPAVVLSLFFALPLARTLEAAFPAAEAWAWFSDDYVQKRLRVALLQAVLSVALTLALAVPLAWHHHRRALPWSRVHLAVHAAPFVLPVFVVAFGVRGLLGPGGWTESLLGAPLVVSPLASVVVAHAYYNYGFAARLLHATLERRPHGLEDAARTLGAEARGAFWRVTFPLLWPGLASVALLVFLFSFTSFGVVLILGGREVATLETLLYGQLGGVFRRLDRAAVLGVVQLAINVALLLGYLALRRREPNLPRDPARTRLPARARDLAAQWGALLLGLAPAASVLVGAFRVRDRWTLEAWRAVFDTGHPLHLAGFDPWKALDLSVFYAAWSMGLSIGLTLLLAYGLQGLGRWPRRVAEAAAALPLGTSSLLIGFGYTLTFGAGAALDLRGTKTLIVLAHTLVAFPFTARVLLPALDQRDRRLDEAATLLGARPFDIVRRVHWPQLRAPLLAAAGFALAMSLGDFGASLLLMRRENMALSVWIEEHRGRAFDLFTQAQASVLTVVLMALATLAYVLVERFRAGGRDL